MTELSPPTTGHVVFIGNPIDGAAVWGPFDNWDEAAAWALRETNDTWWIAPLHKA